MVIQDLPKNRDLKILRNKRKRGIKPEVLTSPALESPFDNVSGRGEARDTNLTLAQDRLSTTEHLSLLDKPYCHRHCLGQLENVKQANSFPRCQSFRSVTAAITSSSSPFLSKLAVAILVRCFPYDSHTSPFFASVPHNACPTLSDEDTLSTHITAVSPGIQ